MKSGFAAIKAWLGGLVRRIGFDRPRDWLSDIVSSFHQRWKSKPTEKYPEGKEAFTETLVLASRLTDYSGGDCAIRFFEETKKGQHIYITYFSSAEMMSDEYIAAQKQALKDGVYVTRIIARKHKDRVRPEFRDWEKEYPGQYELHFYPGSRPFPMDFAVRDDDAEALFVLPPHPEEDFSVALTLRDPVLVQAFRAVFTVLVLNAPLRDSNDKPVKTA